MSRIFVAMCSRYNLISPPEAVRRHFNAEGEADFPPRYNIAPSEPVLVVLDNGRHQRELRLMRWGLIPAWAKRPTELSTLINARAESAAEKPAFRACLRHRRCLVPADGFYEWKGKAGARQPYLVRRRGGGLLAFAGLWEHWLGADGSEIESVAIVTAPARGEVRRVHERMPVMVEPGAFELWLDCRPGTAVGLEPVLMGTSGEDLEVLEIDPCINAPGRDGADVLRLRQTRLL